MELVKPGHEIITPIDGDAILKRIEAAGRTCYKSEDRITPDSAKKFVKFVTERGHHSVIEHEGFSARFVCDRGVTHEMVRHRLAAFSQESTRYCNYGKGVKYILPPWVDILPGNYETIQDLVDTGKGLLPTEQAWFNAMLNIEAIYINMLDQGWSPQQARTVLPNSLKTEIVMTANIREWRHVFNLRCSKAAHPQIVEVMTPLLDEVHSKIPVLFDDLWDKYCTK